MGDRTGVIFDNPFIKVDPLVDPITSTPVESSARGKPYSVPDQTVDIAIVRDSGDPAERDPNDPRLLVNGENIATTGNSPRHTLLYAENPIVWYMASIEDKM